MADPVRVVLLGNGFAERSQLPALRWAGGNEVIGLAGRDLDKARATAERWSIPHATDRWESLLELDPDLVIVSTPVDLHAPMVRRTLETRAAVLCEKPFTLDVGEAEELCGLAEGRAAWIDHELRWNPLRRRMRELLLGGAIGDVRLADSRMLVGSPGFRARPFGWWFEKERGGGILGALASHMIDALRWELGEVESVGCELATCIPQRPDPAGTLHTVTADDHALLWLRFENGALGELVTSAVRGSEHDTYIEYEGADGALRLVGDHTLSMRAPGADIFEPVRVEPGLPEAKSLGMGPGAFARTLPLFLRDVVRTVASGKTTLPGAATFADGLAVQRVLDAARASAADAGGWMPCR